MNRKTRHNSVDNTSKPGNTWLQLATESALDVQVQDGGDEDGEDESEDVDIMLKTKTKTKCTTFNLFDVIQNSLYSLKLDKLRLRLD